MPSFAELLQQGTGHAWLFAPSAILLGALHGLEPGHSKTMMAAFIVAIRGTVGQAVLLGLAATVSHTFVVWVIALGGMYVGRNLDAETTEPYFQLGSAVLIVSIALWYSNSCSSPLPTSIVPASRRRMYSVSFLDVCDSPSMSRRIHHL